MEKLKATYDFEIERFISSGLQALLAFFKLICIFLEGLALIGKNLFLLLLNQGMVIYRHSPTKFEYINPAEKRMAGNYEKIPPRFFS